MLCVMHFPFGAVQCAFVPYTHSIVWIHRVCCHVILCHHSNQDGQANEVKTIARYIRWYMIESWQRSWVETPQGDLCDGVVSALSSSRKINSLMESRHWWWRRRLIEWRLMMDEMTTLMNLWRLGGAHWERIIFWKGDARLFANNVVVGVLLC